MFHSLIIMLNHSWIPYLCINTPAGDFCPNNILANYITVLRNSDAAAVPNGRLALAIQLFQACLRSLGFAVLDFSS